MLARERIAANSIPQAIQAAPDDNMNMIMEEEKKEEMILTNAPKQQAEPEEDLSNYVTVDGVIIKQDFDHLIMAENEVDKYTPLQSATMEQTLYVPY